MTEIPERLGAAAPAGPERPHRALDEIAAERNADRAAVAERQAEAVSFDARCAAIGGCLMGLYAKGGKVADDLELFVDEGRFPDEAAVALAEYEAGKRDDRPDFDITDIHPVRIVRALKQAFEARADEAAIAAREAEAAAEAEKTDLEADQNAELAEAAAAEAATTETEADQTEANETAEKATGIARLEAIIANADALPPEEVARAAAFLRIRELAQTEEDAALITQRIEAQDFSRGIPDPGAFIRTEIFSSSAHDTGVSEETQEAIAKEFGIERFPTVDTGSEVRAVATITTTDPETGETVPAYTEEHPAEFRPGVGAWSSNGEDVYLTAAIPGHPPVTREVTGWSDDDICLLAEAMGFAAGMEHFGATGFAEDVYKIDFALFTDSAFDRDSLRQIRQMIGAMVGGFEGYDGDIFDVRDKIGLLRHQARLINPEGTAHGFENDREATRAAVRKLGLRDADGRVNLDVMTAFGRYAQETYLSGDPSHVDLQAYLYRQFPAFVEPPQDSPDA